MPWTVYILRCADDSLYTGIALDLEKRLAQHADGSGAKYMRGRTPFAVIHTEAHETRSAALKRESAIKALSKDAKLQLALPAKKKKEMTPLAEPCPLQ